MSGVYSTVPESLTVQWVGTAQTDFPKASTKGLPDEPTTLTNPDYL